MQDWARRILEGDVRALARAATGIENRDPRALAVLREVSPQAGKATVLGITGPPGAGKSSLVDAIARVLRAEGRTIGIVAVDPSSRASGGAILGDRIRMQRHHADPDIFIRSMATRGSLGGLARATRDMARLLDAAGKDFVIIETVGVGQDEIDISNLAQVTALVLVPGMGDDVQAIKAGIMEIADVYVINKADHPGADRVEREVRGLLGLARRADGWVPPVVKTVATEDRGIPELLAAIRQYQESGLAVGRAQAAAAHFAIDHLGIAVRSIDQSLVFYRDQLGMPVSPRETVESEKVDVAMLAAGSSRLELLEATEPESTIARFIQKRGEGLHHVALRVPDLAAVVARLKSAGAKLIGEPRRGAGGHEYIFVHPSSAGGVLLELIQDQENSI
jgi:LAO/AO transport system kinase